MRNINEGHVVHKRTCARQYISTVTFHNEVYVSMCVHMCVLQGSLSPKLKRQQSCHTHGLFRPWHVIQRPTQLPAPYAPTSTTEQEMRLISIHKSCFNVQYGQSILSETG